MFPSGISHETKILAKSLSNILHKIRLLNEDFTALNGNALATYLLQRLIKLKHLDGKSASLISLKLGNKCDFSQPSSRKKKCKFN